MNLVVFKKPEDRPVEVEPARGFQSTCSAQTEGWTCTRRRGHRELPRRHQAGLINGRVIAEWDQEEGE